MLFTWLREHDTGARRRGHRTAARYPGEGRSVPRRLGSSIAHPSSSSWASPPARHARLIVIVVVIFRRRIQRRRALAAIEGEVVIAAATVAFALRRNGAALL